MPRGVYPTFREMRMPKGMTTGIVLLVLAGAGCSQRVETEEEHAARERERPLLPASAAPAALTTGGTVEAMPRGPAEIMDGPARAAPGAEGSVSGVIQAPGLDAPPAGAVLFVFVRAVDTSGGPPLAVQRHSPAGFPVRYTIGPADAMMGPAPFPERVVVEARLDSDGDPLSRAPGDLSARSGPVAPGSEGVTLTLSAGGG